MSGVQEGKRAGSRALSPGGARSAKEGSRRRVGGASSGRRVVIIDAEDAFRRKSVRALKGEGHQAVGYRRVPEALAAFTRMLPELVLVDLSLPNREGVALFRTIRTDSNAAHLPFLFLSRGGHPLEITRGVRLDDTVLLKKPFARSRLLEWTRPMLDRLEILDRFGSAGQFEGGTDAPDLTDVLGLIQSYALSGLLSVWPSNGGDPARMSFEMGRMTAAWFESLQGADVVMEVMLWRECRYQFGDPAGEMGSQGLLNLESWHAVAESWRVMDRGRLNPFPLPIRGAMGSRPAEDRGSGVARSGCVAARDIAPVHPGKRARSARSSRSSGEKEVLVYGPPPPRWEDDELDMEIVLSEALPDISEMESLDLTPLPIWYEAFDPLHRAIEPSSGGRSELLAYVVRRRDWDAEDSSTPVFDLSRLPYEALVMRDGGGIVASTMRSKARRSRAASVAALLRNLLDGAAVALMGEQVTGFAIELTNGSLVYSRAGSSIDVIFLAPPDNRLGSVVVDAQRVASRFERGGVPYEDQGAVSVASRGKAGGRRARGLGDPGPSASPVKDAPRDPLQWNGDESCLEAALRSLHHDIKGIEASLVVGVNRGPFGSLAPAVIGRAGFTTVVRSIAFLCRSSSRTLQLGEWRMAALLGGGSFLVTIPLRSDTLLAAKGRPGARLGMVLFKLRQSTGRILRALGP